MAEFSVLSEFRIFRQPRLVARARSAEELVKSPSGGLFSDSVRGDGNNTIIDGVTAMGAGVDGEAGLPVVCFARL
jgi:hypothetical protein